jgi:hypothetical protein
MRLEALRYFFLCIVRGIGSRDDVYKGFRVAGRQIALLDEYFTVMIHSSFICLYYGILHSQVT